MERRVETYLFAAPDATIAKRELFYECGVSLDNDEDHADSSKKRFLTKQGNLCAGPAEKVDKILSVYNYIRDWPKIPADELHAFQR